MKKGIGLAVFVLLLAVAGFICFRYYDFVFAKTIVGQVAGVQRVTQPTAILGTAATTSAQAMHSYAVAIRDLRTGDIYTGSTEDRQWAVVTPGICAEAKYFPYPPWDLESAGTFHNVRLVRQFDCPSGTPSMTAPAALTPPAVAAPPAETEGTPLLPPKP